VQGDIHWSISLFSTWWAVAQEHYSYSGVLPVLMAFPAWVRVVQVVWLPQTAGSKGQQMTKTLIFCVEHILNFKQIKGN
jgi:hypothetical protein